MSQHTDRWQRFERSSDAYAAVTGILLLLIVVPILTSEFDYVERVSTTLLVGAAVTISMAASHTHRWAMHTSWAATLMVLVSTFFADIRTEFLVIGGLILALLLIWTPVVILRRVGVHDHVTATTIFGAIAAYLAFGIAFSLMYSVVFILDSGAFANLTSPGLGETNYFSFVTMTTLGYGDIAPISNLARALVVFQTLIGQIYLVVVVARVVSLLGKPIQPLKRISSD